MSHFSSAPGLRKSAAKPFGLAAACLLLLSGCVQIDQTIRLNEDGSGELVEVVRFDDRLIQAAKSAPDLQSLSDYLKEEQVRRRLPLYGEVTLAGHEVKDLQGGGWQARTVLKFKDIDKLTIPAPPHRGANWNEQKIGFQLREPRARGSYPNLLFFDRPLAIFFTPGVRETPAAAKPLPPSERERLRVLLPVVRSMLEGFRASLKLEAFAPISGAECKVHVIFEVDDRQFADDEKLLQLIEWNRYPDADFPGVGTVMNGPYEVAISLPIPTTQVQIEKSAEKVK